MDEIIKEDIKSICSEELPWEKLFGKKVLITGATGFLGSYIVNVLLYLNNLYDSDIKVYALCRNYDKFKKRFAGYISSPNLELINQDICEQLSDKYKCDIIIHAASPANNFAYINDPIGVIKTNFIGCENILNKCLQWGVEQIVVFSSSAVYGLRDEFKENDERYRGNIDFSDIRHVYAISKQLEEMLVSAFKGEKKIGSIKVLRPFLIYGPGDCYCTGKAITDFIKNSICGEKIYVKSKLDFYRSYVYISDMIKALFYVILLGKEEVYNISSHKNVYSIRELAHYISEINGKVQVSEEEINDKKFLVGNSHKLEKLGWKSKIDLYTGLQRTIEWAKNSELFLDKEM